MTSIHETPRDLEEAVRYLADTAQELNDLASLDTMEMYRHLTTLGNHLEDRGTPEKVPENFVQGCTSNVYISARMKDGRIHYQGSSEALVVRGYVAILVEALSGLEPARVVHDMPAHVQEFADVTNIRATLTPSRANAFSNIFRLMQEKAARSLEAGR